MKENRANSSFSGSRNDPTAPADRLRRAKSLRHEVKPTDPYRFPITGIPRDFKKRSDFK